MPSTEPLTVLYIASFLVFAASQVVYMVPSKMLCQVRRYPRCPRFTLTHLGRHQTESWTGRSLQQPWKQAR
jgi:hypothetical protein